jgi:hypothetical protein
VPTATWRENEDTVSPTDSPYVNKEETVRLRIAVANSKDWPADNYQYRLEFGTKNGTCANVSSWTVVPTATGTPAFGMVTSSYFDNYSSTTARLANSEGYSFTPGYLLESPANITGGISLDGLYYTEIEYTITPTVNAVAGETYCFRVTNNGAPLDDYEIYPELRLAPPPTSSFVYARQKNDGSNIVDITIQANDLNGDDLRAKLEFATGTACDFTSIGDPTLDETDENITATYGDPAIDNNSFYQIGTGTDMIVTKYGTNTVSFDWQTFADLVNADNTYCLRLMVNDGYDNQTPLATTTVVVDHIDPTAPGDLTIVGYDSNSVTLGFGTSSSDTNFSEYKIFYKEGSSGVTESDSVWASTSDANLAYADYNGATTTRVTGLETNKQYVFNIWAYDQYGHKAAAANEVTVTLKYVSRSENWRFYYDQFNETPTSSIAAENTAPTDIVAGSVIKLRLALREIEGITGENVKIRLQYSTVSDFSADVHFVGEIGSTTAIWTYGDGVDEDNDPVTQALLSGITAGATHNESGISTTSYDHVAGTAAEWEFTIRNNGAPVSTTYYFRAYDNTNGEAILVNTGFSYPSLVTSAGALSFTVSGLGVGSTTEGVTTNVAASPTDINFGTLLVGSEKIAAQRFTVTTNAGSGYQLFVYERQNLLSNSGADIDPVPGTNESPAGWPAIPDPSAFGYHTGDETLSGASPSRFAPDNTYARLETNMKEIGYSPIPVSADTIDLVYRIEINNLQEAGDYETEIVYILVPTF